MEKQQILSIAIGSLLALGLAGNAHAADTKFEKGQCYSTYNLGYVVNQKIDKNHYGAVATYPQYVMTGFLHENAIITIARPLVEGGILNASVEYIGTVTRTLNNGFDVKVDLLKECTAKQEQVAAETDAERKKRQAPKGFVSQGGLTWMPISDSGMTWSDANAYCSNTVINGQTGWRLPTKEELSSMNNSRAMDGQGVTLTHTWNSTATTLAWGTAPVSQPAYNNVTCVR